MRIYEENGLLFGRIETILDPTRVARRCDLCSDERKDQPMLGMQILRQLKKDREEFNGGNILDPDNGHIYRCKLKLIEKGTKLQVRGYIGISLLGRSQVWLREE